MARKSHTRPVLLIDDSHEDLFLAKRLLARAGVTHPIVTIDGGEEAIVFLRATTLPGATELRPVLIFCDVKMPIRDGFEVLQWVRSQKMLERVPMYILSGGNLETDKEKALQLGATGYFAKFPSAETLKQIIDLADGDGAQPG